MSKPAPRNQARIYAIPYPWVVVALTTGTQMATALSGWGLPVLYPFIGKEFGLSRAQVGLISGLLGGGGIGTVLLGGRLADLLGVKRVMIVLLGLTATLMFSLSLAKTFPALLIVAVLLGACDAPTFPAAARAIMDWLPRRTRALAMGIQQMGVPMGGALAAAAAPSIALAFGWRTSAAAVGGITALMLLVFLALYREAPRASAGIRPSAGVALSVLAHNRGLAVATIWGTAFASVQLVVISYILLYLIEDLNMGAVVAGGYLAALQITNMFARVLWGAASDFLFGGRRKFALAVLGVLATTGLVALALLQPGARQFVILPIVILLGGTVVSWSGVFGTFVAEMAGAGQTGTAIGAANTVMRVGMFLLPPLFGLLVDISDSYSLAWGLAAFIACAATLALMVFGKEPRPE